MQRRLQQFHDRDICKELFGQIVTLLQIGGGIVRDPHFSARVLSDKDFQR